MAVVLRPVHPALRGCLAGPMVAYDLDVTVSSVHLGVPSPTATLILAFDDPLDVGWLATPSTSSRYWSSVSGLHLGPALVRTHGIQRGIQVALTPLGCRCLLGVPLAALAHTTVELERLPLGLSPVEHERIDAALDWRTRLELVERAFLERLGGAPARSADLSRAWRLLTAGRPVAQTADAVGWSRRHLQTLLRAEVGLTPKQVSRIGRLQHARTLVAGGTSLVQAAHAAGYADQSHLSREWHLLTGRPPSASGEEFPNLHDVLSANNQD